MLRTETHLQVVAYRRPSSGRSVSFETRGCRGLDSRLDEERAALYSRGGPVSTEKVWIFNVNFFGELCGPRERVKLHGPNRQFLKLVF